LSNRKEILKALVITVVIACLTVGVVYAVSYLTVTSQDSDVITPLPAPTPETSPTTEPTATPTETTYTLQLAWNTTTPYIGESVQFTAQLNPAVEDITVFFYRRTPTRALLGNATTDSTGTATFNTAPLLTENPKTFMANCTIPIP